MDVARLYRDGVFSHLIPWPNTTYHGPDVLIAYGMLWFEVRVTMGDADSTSVSNHYVVYGEVPEASVPKHTRLYNLLME